MLTPTEELGLRNILNDLLDTHLFSLADTVTKRLVENTDRSTAIDTIIACLEKPSDLLKRQRVTKRVLFCYLLKIKPGISPECKKEDLVRMCLQEWQSIEECKEDDYESSSHANINCLGNDWLSSMSTQFTEWFFPIYNELEEFIPEHFWLDCKLMGELRLSSDYKQASVVGNSNVVSFLSSLIWNDKFYFHANNNQDSLICEQDPHGLVKIVVSGVVHQFSNCIGLFDWLFGLVENPADKTWKIKCMHLKIQVTGGMKQMLSPTNHPQNIQCSPPNLAIQL